jgi:hypothetical protein
MWQIVIVDVDCTRRLSEPETFEDELAMFEVLCLDFNLIRFLGENEHGLLYELSRDNVPGSVHILASEA